ncbi:MAG: hypothetical protein RLZZ292_2310 [Bacteroidota bacterium]|jgi:hypothetical protein
MEILDSIFGKEHDSSTIYDVGVRYGFAVGVIAVVASLSSSYIMQGEWLDLNNGIKLISLIVLAAYATTGICFLKAIRSYQFIPTNKNKITLYECLVLGLIIGIMSAIISSIGEVMLYQYLLTDQEKLRFTPTMLYHATQWKVLIRVAGSGILAFLLGVFMQSK